MKILEMIIKQTGSDFQMYLTPRKFPLNN